MELSRRNWNAHLFYQNIRPELAMSAHQCAQISANPKLSHERAVMRIGKYLLETKYRGIIFCPDPSRGLEFYVDAGFVGEWDPKISNDAESVYSWTGFFIFFSRCPLMWTIKLQS